MRHLPLAVPHLAGLPLRRGSTLGLSSVGPAPGGVARPRMPRPALSWVAAILAGLLALPAGGVQAASPQPAECEITVRGERFDGPCQFTPDKGGSFDVHMTDRRPIAGATGLSLDVTARGTGDVRGVTAAGVNSRWGPVTRQADDGACWRGADFTLCVRAPDEPRPGGGPAVFAGRCHMDQCSWIDQSPARDIGRGSRTVPGRLVEVTERHAVTEHRGGAYPDSVPAGLDWSPGITVRYFCSTARPAIREPGGGWRVLPLPEVFGYSQAATQMYLHACHRGAGSTPYATPEQLGYRKGLPAVDSYPDFNALIGR